MGWLSSTPKSTTGAHSVAWWKRQPTTTVDPRTLRMADTPVSRRHVDQYKANLNRRSTDGDPCMVIRRDGVRELRNGKHRAIAAIETGRRLKVRVVDERKGGR